MSERIVADFVNYADVVFRHFGWRVKNWMTFNEPWCTCALGYGKGEFAPGTAGGDAAQYAAAHNLLLAHSAAMKLYNEKFRATQVWVTRGTFYGVEMLLATLRPECWSQLSNHCLLYTHYRYALAHTCHYMSVSLHNSS